MLDLRYVKKLVEMLDESSLDAIEISTEKGLKIRVSKAVTGYAPVPVATPPGHPDHQSRAGIQAVASGWSSGRRGPGSCACGASSQSQ